MQNSNRWYDVLEIVLNLYVHHLPSALPELYTNQLIAYLRYTPGRFNVGEWLFVGNPKTGVYFSNLLFVV